MNSLQISVIIPVKNDSVNLENCLSHLNDFSEVIVIDSNSTDNTKLIAQKYNVDYINFEWNGHYPKKRNWALDNIQLQNDWVLFLDADEQLTEAFISELHLAIQNHKFSGYLLTYSNHFMGKKLRYGDKMQKLALFKSSKGRYERINEENWSNLDMEVHEHPIINGDIGELKSPIIHNDYNNLNHYLAKHNEYSSWEAKRYLMLKKEPQNTLTRRQKIKYRLLTSPFFPTIYFFVSYFLKLGILDGKQGYYLAKFKSQYFFQIRIKIIEQKIE